MLRTEELKLHYRRRMLEKESEEKKIVREREESLARWRRFYHY